MGFKQEVLMALIVCMTLQFSVLQQADLTNSVWRCYTGQIYQFTAMLQSNGNIKLLLRSSAYSAIRESTWRFNLNSKVLTFFDAKNNKLVDFVFNFRDRYSKWRLVGRFITAPSYNFYTLQQLI